MSGHIHMTDEELKKLWRNRALTDNQMVRCLADLNACDTKAVVEKLQSLGLAGDEILIRLRTPSAFSAGEVERIIEMVMMGVPCKAIAQRLHRSHHSIYDKVRLLRKTGRIV